MLPGPGIRDKTPQEPHRRRCKSPRHIEGALLWLWWPLAQRGTIQQTAQNPMDCRLHRSMTQMSIRLHSAWISNPPHLRTKSLYFFLAGQKRRCLLRSECQSPRSLNSMWSRSVYPGWRHPLRSSFHAARFAGWSANCYTQSEGRWRS